MFFATVACTDGLLDAGFSSADTAPRSTDLNDTPTDEHPSDSQTAAESNDTEPVFIWRQAENFDFLNNNGIAWTWKTFDQTVADEANELTATAQQGAYLQALWNNNIVTDTDTSTDAGSSWFGKEVDAAQSCQVGYYVTIPHPGLYYVWVRGWSGGAKDNSIHVGKDNTWPATSINMQFPALLETWIWSSNQRGSGGRDMGIPLTIFVEFETAGTHSIQFAMREDKFVFDAWLLTNDPTFDPNTSEQ